MAEATNDPEPEKQRRSGNDVTKYSDPDVRVGLQELGLTNRFSIGGEGARAPSIEYTASRSSSASDWKHIDHQELHV